MLILIGVDQLIWLGVFLLLERRRRRREAQKLATQERLEQEGLEHAFGDLIHGTLVPPGNSPMPEDAGIRASVAQWRADADAASPPAPALAPAASGALPASPARRSRNFIRNHWQGLYSLGVSYWVFGFLLSLIIQIASLAALVVFLLDDGYEPVPLFFGMVASFAILGLLDTWKFTGLWRSASRRVRERRAQGKRAFWAIAVKVNVALGVVAAIATMVGAGLLPIAMLYTIAFMGDPMIPGYKMEANSNGTAALIRGGFKYGLTQDFERLLKEAPNLRTVYLDSPGGRLGEGLKLQEAIQKAELNTRVAGTCASACTFAFLGGIERTLGPQSTLGFHAASTLGPEDTFLTLLLMARPMAAMFSANINAQFTGKALATPSTDLWTPRIAELLAANVITSPSAFAWAIAPTGRPGVGETPQWFAKRSPILTAMWQTYPDDFAVFIEGVYAQRDKGDSDGTIDTAVRHFSHAAVRNHIASASDEAVLALARLLMDELLFLQTRNPRACAVLASTKGGDAEVQFSLQRHMARYQAAGARIVSSSTTPRTGEPVQLSEINQHRLTHQSRMPPDVAETTPEQFASYCRTVLWSYRIIMNSPPAEAAEVFRRLFKG